MTKGLLLVLVVAFGLVGCAGLRQFPEVSQDYATDLGTLDKDYDAALKKIYASTNASTPKTLRNQMIETRMAVIDAHFMEFQAGLVKENVRADFLIALIGVGVGGAGALASETASQILSAVSGGLAGGQAAYSKAVLYDKAMSALIAQMQASRKAVAVAIFERWNEDIDQYPMWMARTDLEAYYFAGSLPGAIIATAADAKVKDADAEDKLAKLRANKFSEDQAAVAIQKFLFPPDGKSTNTPDAGNVKKLRDWLDKSPVAGLPVANFVTNPELRSLRERAIREIPIP
jgi:hypothetical protein